MACVSALACTPGLCGATSTPVPRGAAVKGREVHHKGDKADIGSGVGAEAGKFRQGFLKQPDGGGTLHRNHEEPGVEGGLVCGHAPAVGCALH